LKAFVVEGLAIIVRVATTAVAVVAIAVTAVAEVIVAS